MPAFAYATQISQPQISAQGIVIASGVCAHLHKDGLQWAGERILSGRPRLY